MLPPPLSAPPQGTPRGGGPAHVAAVVVTVRRFVVKLLLRRMHLVLFMRAMVLLMAVMRAILLGLLRRLTKDMQ